MGFLWLVGGDPEPPLVPVIPTDTEQILMSEYQYQDEKKDKPEPRKNRIPVRLSDSEKAKLLALADGRELAPWIREICMNEKPRHRITPPKIDPILIRHLASIGNNVNQIARALNSNPDVETALVAVEISHIQKALDELVRLNSAR